MKSHLGILAVVFTVLACGLAFSQNPPAQNPPPSPTDKLEKDLAASRLRIEALSSEVTDLKHQMAATLKYLEAQSKSAASMARVLDESEEAGFTYGINPNSRHVLLKGWRDQLATAQKEVPGQAAAAPANGNGHEAPKTPPKVPEKSSEKTQEE